VAVAPAAVTVNKDAIRTRDAVIGFTTISFSGSYDLSDQSDTNEWP
jgi:hypothetical protein